MEEAFFSVWDKECSQKLRMKLCAKHKKYHNQYWPDEQQVVQACMENAGGDSTSLACWNCKDFNICLFTFYYHTESGINFEMMRQQHAKINVFFLCYIYVR